MIPVVSVRVASLLSCTYLAHAGIKLPCALVVLCAYQSSSDSSQCILVLFPMCVFACLLLQSIMYPPPDPCPIPALASAASRLVPVSATTTLTRYFFCLLTHVHDSSTLFDVLVTIPPYPRKPRYLLHWLKNSTMIKSGNFLIMQKFTNYRLSRWREAESQAAQPMSSTLEPCPNAPSARQPTFAPASHRFFSFLFILFIRHSHYRGMYVQVRLRIGFTDNL